MSHPSSARTALIRWSNGIAWNLLVLALVVAAAFPVASVAWHLTAPSGEVWEHLAATVLPIYLANSLWLMLGVGFGVSVGGIGTAWLVTMCRFPGSRVLEWALLLPMAMPAYVVAYTYTGLLDYPGPVQSTLRAAFGWTSPRDYWFPEIRSLGGAAAVMSMVLYPYVYMLARSAFLSQSVCVLEASRTLGRTPLKSFFQVALPLARPAIVTGIALALMETLNDFGTVHYFAVDTFTTGIYRTWLGMGQPAVAAQLGAVLMVFILGLLIAERTSRGSRRFHHTTGRYRHLAQLRLHGWKAPAAMIFCFLPIVLGFLLPAGILGSWALNLGVAEALGDGFGTLTLNSLILAALAGAAAVAAGLVLAYAQRLRPSRLVRAGVRAASLGYAVPGSVIAVGAMVPLTRFDHLLAGHLGTGLILTGGIAALVYAYLVRFLAIATNGIESALSKVTPNIEAASRSLGQSPLGTLRHVHLPMIRGGLMTAGLLVFVDVMKELPATLIMRPFNFDTLATRAFTLASDERLSHAAAPALAIVLAGLIPVMLLTRAIRQSRPGGGQ